MNTQCNVFLIFWGYFCFCFYFLVFSEICHCCYFPYIFISLPLPFPHSFCPVSTPSSPILQLLTSARNVFITSLYILIYRKHILETHCHRATFCSLSLSSLRAYYNWLCSPNFLKLRSYLSRVLLKSCLVDFFLICCLCMIPERGKKKITISQKQVHIGIPDVFFFKVIYFHPSFPEVPEWKSNYTVIIKELAFSLGGEQK